VLGTVEAESKEYRDEVLPPSIKKRLAVEAGVRQGWDRYVGDEGDVILPGSIRRFRAG
jgi:transketolase